MCETAVVLLTQYVSFLTHVSFVPQSVSFLTHYCGIFDTVRHFAAGSCNVGHFAALVLCYRQLVHWSTGWLKV